MIGRRSPSACTLPGRARERFICASFSRSPSIRAVAKIGGSGATRMTSSTERLWIQIESLGARSDRGAGAGE